MDVSLSDGRNNINGEGRNYCELFLLGEKEKKYFDVSLWFALGCFSREWCNL